MKEKYVHRLLAMESRDSMLINTTSNVVLAQRVEVADHFLSRLKGLMLKDKIDKDYALILAPCSSIHTFFMKFNIDVLFVDQEKTVLSIYSNLGRGQVIKPLKNCQYVIEMRAQNIHKKVQIRDKINW